MTAARALRNYQLSQYRVIVENAIGRLKRWAVVGSKFRHWHLVEDPDAVAPDFSFLERIMRVLCALTNWRVRVEDLRPLRTARWSPKPSDAYMSKLNTRAENELAAGKKDDYARFLILRDAGEDMIAEDDLAEAYLYDPRDDSDFDAKSDGIVWDEDDSDDDSLMDDELDDDDSMYEERAATAAAPAMAASSAQPAAAYELRPREHLRPKRRFLDSYSE